MNKLIKLSCMRFKNLYLLGAGLSLFWILLMTLMYFNAVNQYPKSYDEYFSLNIAFNFCDPEYIGGKWEVVNGKWTSVQTSIFNDVRPIFSSEGFNKLVLLPIINLWFLVYVFITRRRTFFIISSVKCSILVIPRFITIMYFLFNYFYIDYYCMGSI